MHMQQTECIENKLSNTSLFMFGIDLCVNAFDMVFTSIQSLEKIIISLIIKY